ncbi:hypothetical protein [Candidatus Reidiella endopervernicosa]|uniref:Uncharacterized protein n=1 Tax=Candidatus Reidiella endopervernicosa TaxID=2738883 RepID=A0A6N0HXV4_9GAMM|nr:hypothetical protein [Candidatus Reidiella endopervernicosa]QKQ27178.1 hypothetical protein HUE57_13415 [Candidatus Reidiella endopervernicosa]
MDRSSTAVAELPEELSELRVSADGRVLTAREEWDSNGNGESFELIAAIWSDKQHRFIPVSTLIEQPLQQISDIRSLWSGRGIVYR